MAVNKFDARLEALRRGEFQPPAFFLETAGLSAGAFEKVRQNVVRWAERSGRHAVQGTGLSRWVFERYYANFELLTPRQAAGRLGIKLKSLPKVITYSNALGVPADASGDGRWVRADFVARISRFFPPPANKIYSDHTHFCRALHRALRAQGVEVEEAIDPTSEALATRNAADEPDCSYGFDLLTLEPLGLRFEVWLDFKKPMDLEPDKTSALTYVKNESRLANFVPDFAPPDPQMLARVREAAGLG